MANDYVIEFNREGIRRYRRWQGLWIGYLAVGPFFAFLGLMSGLPNKNNGIAYAGIMDMAMSLIARASIAYAIGFTICLIIIMLTVGRTARRYANGIAARVTGPYLNVVETRLMSSCDRKIHFNQLMDYSVIQDPEMRRAGISAIRIGMNYVIQNGNRNYNSYITLPGVVNALATRDKLIELDAEREKMPG